MQTESPLIGSVLDAILAALNDALARDGRFAFLWDGDTLPLSIPASSDRVN